MIERDLNQFLTDDERTLIEADRRITVARTLASQANLLVIYGATDEHIRDNVAHMRVTFDQLPTESIVKVQKSISDHTLALAGIQPIAVTAPTTVSLERTVQEVPETLAEPVAIEEKIADEAVVQFSDVTENEIDKSAPGPRFNRELVLETDDRQPKGMTAPLNNVFVGVLSYEERTELLMMDDVEKEAFVAAFEDVIKKYNRLPKHAPIHAKRLQRMLDGMNATEAAAAEGVGVSTISSAFSSYLPQVLSGHRTELIDAYERYLAGESLPDETSVEVDGREDALESGTTEEVALAKRVKQVKPKAECPEGLDGSLNNILADALSLEERAALLDFRQDQKAALVELMNRIYEKAGKKPDMKAVYIDRFEKLLGGATIRDIAESEGVHKMAIVQGFNVFLASIPRRYPQEFALAYDAIRSMQPLASEQTGISELIEGSTVEVANMDMQANGSAPGTMASVQAQKTPSEQKNETYSEEPLVSLVKGVYNTDDPEALAGITDLFSTEKGVIGSSEQSIEAARYFRGIIQRSGVSLSMSIDNPTARSAVERLLEGVGSGEDRKWFTLSEILDETPEGLRAGKQRSVSNALNKIIRQLDRPSLVKEDPREKQVSVLRSELHKYVDLPAEITRKIIDRALEEEIEFTADMGKALLQVYSIAAGVGLSETEHAIMRLFVIPRPGSTPRSVAEIREVLKKDNKLGVSVKQLENGYVSSKLLRAFDKIVVQRRDG